MSLDKEIFKGKPYGALLEEIYDNQRKKDKKIQSLITELQQLINEPGDALVLVPLIKDYLEVSIKNDKQLVEIAQILQKVFNTNGKPTDNFGLSQEEVDQLMSEVGVVALKEK